MSKYIRRNTPPPLFVLILSGPLQAAFTSSNESYLYLILLSQREHDDHITFRHFQGGSLEPGLRVNAKCRIRTDEHVKKDETYGLYH